MADVTLTATAAALMAAGLEYPGAYACESELHPLLQRLATEHARYQAEHRQQGHQGFQKRFDEIHASLGLFAVEIAAESWKRQENASLADLGKEMFHCWEQSPGHWKVASRKHTFFGGEMAKGKNGIWYACILAAD